MCKCLWECIKCPGKVVCCCCQCACKMLMSIICSVLVLLIIVGLIVYFTVFHNKDKGGSDEGQRLAEKLIQEHAPENFRDYFKSLQ